MLEEKKKEKRFQTYVFRVSFYSIVCSCIYVSYYRLKEWHEKGRVPSDDVKIQKVANPIAYDNVLLRFYACRATLRCFIWIG